MAARTCRTSTTSWDELEVSLTPPAERSRKRPASTPARAIRSMRTRSPPWSSASRSAVMAPALASGADGPPSRATRVAGCTSWTAKLPTSTRVPVPASSVTKPVPLALPILPSGRTPSSSSVSAVVRAPDRPSGPSRNPEAVDPGGARRADAELAVAYPGPGRQAGLQQTPWRKPPGSGPARPP